ITLARSTLADRDVGDLVLIVARGALLDLFHPGVNDSRFCRAHRVEAVRPNAAALRRIVTSHGAPGRWHLASSVRRIVLRSDRGQEHLEWGNAQRQAQGAVA